MHLSSTSKQINRVEARSNSNRCALYWLMHPLSDNYTISRSFLPVERELESFLLPAARTSQVGEERNLIAIINIESS